MTATIAVAERRSHSQWFFPAMLVRADITSASSRQNAHKNNRMSKTHRQKVGFTAARGPTIINIVQMLSSVDYRTGERRPGYLSSETPRVRRLYPPEEPTMSSSISQCLVVLITVTVTSHGSQLIDRIDYEGGDFSEWRTCSDCSFDGDNPKIVSSPVRTGRRAAMFKTVDKRTEAASERYLDRETDLWVGWSIYVEKFASSPGRADVTQFHGYQSACTSTDPIIHVDIKNLQWGITINYYEGGQKQTVSRDGLGAVRKGAWTDLVANFKLTDTQNGYFNFWIDGDRVLSFKGKTSGNCPEGHYLKAGVYNTPSGSIVYNDAFTVMKNASYAEVAPGGSAPSDPPPSADTLEPNSCVVGSTGWSHYAIGVLAGTTDMRCVVSPSHDKLDAVIAFGDLPGSNYADYGALIRLSPTGIVDARDGDAYVAEQQLSYAAGDTITLRAAFDFAYSKYSVIARKNSGSEVYIARDCAFRTEQATAASFSHLGLITGSGQIELCDYESPAPGDITALGPPSRLCAGVDVAERGRSMEIYTLSGQRLYKGTRAEYAAELHARSGLVLVRTAQGELRRLIRIMDR
ncbi:MAG: hypothetical protein GF331_08660 [Chitinivibrionales bacterium]|nr:hypothetical protein [Chitinivibrionales bacterium]